MDHFNTEQMMIRDMRVIGTLKGVLIKLKWLIEKDVPHWTLQRVLEEGLVELRKVQNQEPLEVDKWDLGG